MNAGIVDGPRASTWDENGLASVGGGNGVAATSGGLTSIDTEDEDGVGDDKLSRGGNSLTTYHFLFVVVPFSLESWDGGWGRSSPPDDISIYRKVILKVY